MDEPRYSIIVPTHGRSAKLAEALASIAAQRSDDVEVVVVQDGDRDADGYARVRARAKARFGDRLQWLRLTCASHGHGPAAVRNIGAAAARGDYLGFLDDDDLWIDEAHLERVLAFLDRDPTVQAVFANQEAVRDGERETEPLWLDTVAHLVTDTLEADHAYPVNRSLLLRAGGFCHLNTLIVQRAFFDQLRGFDECLHYEEDRDFYMRIIDHADRLIYFPRVVARHHVPTKDDATSASRRTDDLLKLINRLRIFDKAVVLGAHADIRRYGRRHKAYTLKSIAERLARSGRRGAATTYAREALGLAPTLGWLLYTCRLALSHVLRTDRSG
jgi:glycosyltransferase involved in cell wall biosynthesis